MTLAPLELVEVDDTTAGDPDAPVHAVCRRCYPVTAPGDVVRHSCGRVRTLREAVPLPPHTVTPCVVCAALTRCDVCGGGFRRA